VDAVTDQTDVDRGARDALVGLLRAYLRGEMGAAEFDRCNGNDPAIGETGDESVALLSHDLWLLYDDCGDRPICVSRETWDWLLRVMAFLRTDLRLMTVRRWAWQSKQAVALLGLLVIGGGAAGSLASDSKVPFVLCWAGVGTFAFFFGQLRGNRPHPEIVAMGRWAPFRSEAQWRAYRGFVEPEGIPAYDPARHNLPRPEDAVPRPIHWSWFLLGPLAGAFVLPWMLGRAESDIHVVKA